MRRLIYNIDHISKEKVTFKDSKGRTRTRRPGSKFPKNGITVHSTANPNSYATGERKYLESPSNKRSASYHIVVDEFQAIEVIPLDETAYHCGRTVGNRHHIGIELCESGNRDVVLRNGAKLIAVLLKLNNWNVGDIKKHREWDNTQTCPRILDDTKWRGFIGMIQKYLDDLMKIEEIMEKDELLGNFTPTSIGVNIQYTQNKEIEPKFVGNVFGYIKDGVSYISTRDVSKLLGYDVTDWDNEDKIVTMSVGSVPAKINGEMTRLDRVMVAGGHNFVPIRSFQALGNVEVDYVDKVVTVDSKGV